MIAPRPPLPAPRGHLRAAVTLAALSPASPLPRPPPPSRQARELTPIPYQCGEGYEQHGELCSVCAEGYEHSLGLCKKCRMDP